MKGTMIKKGAKISVDKGILGKDTGIFVETYGFSAFGFNGVYISDKDHKEHIWDETVHKIKLLNES